MKSLYTLFSSVFLTITGFTRSYSETIIRVIDGDTLVFQTNQGSFKIRMFTTKTIPSTLTPTGIRCFRKGCHGIIKSAIKPDKQEIHWYCPECENEGVISGWYMTKWDNSSKSL